MRNNQPVTQQEFEFPDNATLMSTTDTESYVTYANAAFMQVSGFSHEEIQGQPHNVVRHPDMPKEAFADMWSTLKGGEPWTALVKNRRKNGDHYWVRANATPVVRNGKPAGYMSVRTKASREEIAAAEALYRDFREGKAGNRRFHKALENPFGFTVGCTDGRSGCVAAGTEGCRTRGFCGRERRSFYVRVALAGSTNFATARAGARTGLACRVWRKPEGRPHESR
jgi:PAS domain S-box-containing protein